MNTFGLTSEAISSIYSKIDTNLCEIIELLYKADSAEGHSIFGLKSLEIKRSISEMKLADLDSRLASQKHLEKKTTTSLRDSSPLSGQNEKQFYGTETEIVMLEHSRTIIYRSLYRAADNIQAVNDSVARLVLSPTIGGQHRSVIDLANKIVIEKNINFANKQIHRIEFIRKRLEILYGRLAGSPLLADTFSSYTKPSYNATANHRHGASGFLRKHRSKKPHNSQFCLTN